MRTSTMADHRSEPHGILPDARWRRWFRGQLLGWYRRFARQLPWRKTRDPYRIWLSEIMLQQTQVETVLRYYGRFLDAFPTVRALAEATEEQVLRMWEGLGYYRRARQLHAAARDIVGRYDGRFPRSFVALMELPGVGRYTAGAILSCAFDQRQPIVEANTARLFTRLLGYRGDPRHAAGQRLLWRFATEILPTSACGELNQALMELGSQVCLPRKPDCPSCPVATLCAARAGNLQEVIPIRGRQLRYQPVTEAAVIVRRRGWVLLRRCPSGERWAGLWDFPRFRTRARHTGRIAKELVNWTRDQTGVTIENVCHIATMHHAVTRYRITLMCFTASLALGTNAPHHGWRWLHQNRLPHYPLNVTGRRLARLLATTKHTKDARG